MRNGFYRRFLLAGTALIAASAQALAQAPATPQTQPRQGQPDIPLFQAPQQPQRPQQPTPPQRPTGQAQRPPRNPPPAPPPPPAAPPAQAPTQPATPDSAPPAAPAQTEPFELPPAGTMIVVVDIQQLLRESTAGTSIRGQADRQRALLQGDVAQQESQIRAQQQELVRQQPNLSPEQFNQRRRTIEQRIGELERSVTERRRVLDQSFGEAMNQFQRQTSEIIGEIVQEKQYLIVMNREAIVGFSSVLDITPEVMRRLNTRLTTVPVNIPTASQAPAPATAPAAATPPR
jgi:Skp family chaperone for outer membrane proteins